MKYIKSYIPNVFLLFIMSIFLPFLCSAESVVRNENGSLVIENRDFKYEVTPQGRNLHFIDKATGKDYLDSSAESYAATVTVAGTDYLVNSVVLKGSRLKFFFESSGVSAEINVEGNQEGVIFEIIKVVGDVEAFNFLNIPLTLEGVPNEPFATCALSMNLETHVRQLPALQTHLWATCYNRFGMEGAKITLIGTPMEDILPRIRAVMQNAEDIPYSTAGGAWAKMSEEGRGSYHFNYGSLTEETVDEWIEMCSSVGFNQIDNHGGGKDFFKFGSLELNPEKWPDGWEHFKRINKRLHDAGISSIFHTYAFFIDKNSKYVTPVPSEDLAYFRTFTLAESMSDTDTVIVVNESTENISTLTGFLVQNSRTLKIGNELIEFDAVTKTPPYKFTGCKRGLNGTRVASHRVNEKAHHLKEMFGLFVADPESDLFVEIAHNHARIVNENNFDGIYLDAIDGSRILADKEYYWYYSTKFVIEIMKALDRPVGMEMSMMEHHWWHYRSRWQAWDTPRRGFKNFIDFHSDNINGGLLLPMHLGWWLNFTWGPPQAERTFPDDIEYLCCKMIGHDAGLSLLGGVSEKEVTKYPSFRRLNAIIKQYEGLRHEKYFGEDIKKLLRQPGKEFTLFQENDASWNFKPVVYHKQKVLGINQPSSSWIVDNGFDSQPVKFRIESLMSVKSYDDPDNIVLADFSASDEFSNTGAAEGVSGEIIHSNEKTLDGESGGIFKANNSGVSPRNGSWICMKKEFEPWLDLSQHKALGVWIKGDGNGEILDFRHGGPFHLSHGAIAGHYVKIDFIGWRYFELVELESSEFTNYIWDNSSVMGNLYQSHHTWMDFKSINEFQLWYNNLPEGKESNCIIGPVKAIPMISGIIENPSIKIGEEIITLQVTLESGMYIEFKSVEDCKLYGANGEFIENVPVQGKIPVLKNGRNHVSFTGNSPTGINPRIQVTVMSEGKPLNNTHLH
ncbi:hypothetical protein D1164_21840 [Mariniphaga sediminis]|uniref:Uncharacterized protein n=1 Tax=Mariniphaga sediminis TaxID=1628158 RepID=A0A399CTX9_9BACT|nr:hypothetical protein [Mariniphaga sediminis]RIH62997.1 hypothetical protein D1164_21840 [Mariniphaga sediminis]